MKITVLTSNSLRHIYLIKQLSKISKKNFCNSRDQTLNRRKKDSIYKKVFIDRKIF